MFGGVILVVVDPLLKDKFRASGELSCGAASEPVMFQE
jgi:hypothetical protein